MAELRAGAVVTAGEIREWMAADVIGHGTIIFGDLMGVPLMFSRFDRSVPHEDRSVPRWIDPGAPMVPIGAEDFTNADGQVEFYTVMYVGPLEHEWGDKD